MSKEKSPCVGCRFAEWPLTPTGRIKKGYGARCAAVVPAPVLPLSVTITTTRTYVYADMFIGQTCPLRESI